MPCAVVGVSEKEKSSIIPDYYVNNTVVFETTLFYNGAD
jgi:hypothetical protein